MKPQRVEVTLAPDTKHLLERIAKALEKNQNTTIIIQAPETEQSEETVQP